MRDAVIRGDRSIIRNLELATKKTNNNLQAMVKWSVDAARTETGFLADKLDYMQLGLPNSQFSCLPFEVKMPRFSDMEIL